MASSSRRGSLPGNIKLYARPEAHLETLSAKTSVCQNKLSPISDSRQKTQPKRITCDFGKPRDDFGKLHDDFDKINGYAARTNRGNNGRRHSISVSSYLVKDTFTPRLGRCNSLGKDYKIVQSARRHTFPLSDPINLSANQANGRSKRCNSLDSESNIGLIHSARRHSVALNDPIKPIVNHTNSPSKRRNTVDKDNSSFLRARSDVNSCSRRSFSLPCIDSKRDLQSILKKQCKIADDKNNMGHDNNGSENDGVPNGVPQAWSACRSGSLDHELPLGSDTFRLAMAEFLPQAVEVAPTVSTTKLKDSFEEEEKDGDEEEVQEEILKAAETVCPPVRRIRWSEVVNVIN